MPHGGNLERGRSGRESGNLVSLDATAALLVLLLVRCEASAGPV